MQVSTGGSPWRGMGDHLGDSLGDPLGDPLGGPLGDPLGDPYAPACGLSGMRSFSKSRWNVLECLGMCRNVLECVGNVSECVGLCWNALECVGMCLYLPGDLHKDK
jgi:hypothetical protein